MKFPMSWTCTTVQQGHGRRLSSACLDISLYLHRSGTWLCSLGVQFTAVRSCAGRGGVLMVACVDNFAYAANVVVFPANACNGRWCFECRGLVQQCNRGMVDGSAQRGAHSSCRCIGRERGFVRWWWHRKLLFLHFIKLFECR